MAKRVLLVFMVLCIGLVVGCARKPKGEIAAVVNGKVITLAMVDRRIANLPQHYQTFASQHKKEIINDMIIEQLLYEEAMSRDLKHNPEVNELVAEAKRKIIISKLVEEEAKKAPPVSDDDVKGYYEQHKDQYLTPETVRASHILLGSEEDANKVLAELKQGADFAELAKKYSTDLTKDRGGDLGYFRKGQMIPEFENACFKLTVGQVSDVVKTRFGYHIIKLIDHKDRTYRTFDEVKENIRVLLSRQRQKEKFDELNKNLMDKAKIKINDKLFAPIPAGKRPTAKEGAKSQSADR